ncbi:sugar ABC transporter permease [Amnibacterium sp. CER49]|uniref:carbohydrate ABC transporter permease n=1 Tax=Amnibacterium sp. CER49 TaxID=3039161 RepID=UPI002447599E|nr:sugar ABC transporter permease [Amnibacterium sp. CER49]MDH2443321.1 sugar ABC transporter permease [Amnibacterium sp. CER49]
MTKPRRRVLGRSRKREERSAYLFIAPWIAGFLLFWLAPMAISVVLSLMDWDLLSTPKWIGLQNYAELFFNDRTFWVSVGVTLKYIVLSVPLYLVTGLLLSLLLNLKIRGITVFRTILFIPSILSGVAVAVLWVAMLNPDTGAVNDVLRQIGISSPPRWLQDPSWAVPSIVLVGLWGIGGGAIIYLSGLQNIGAQLYEAARIDGAGAFQRFRFVTLPMLTPTLLFVLLTSLIDAFQVFDTAYVLGGSQGGVGDSLRFYLINLYNAGFVGGRFGYASAMAWILVLAAAAVILIIFRTSGRWVYYEYDPESER